MKDIRRKILVAPLINRERKGVLRIFEQKIKDTGKKILIEREVILNIKKEKKYNRDRRKVNY